MLIDREQFSARQPEQLGAFSIVSNLKVDDCRQRPQFGFRETGPKRTKWETHRSALPSDVASGSMQQPSPDWRRPGRRQSAGEGTEKGNL